MNYTVIKLKIIKHKGFFFQSKHKKKKSRHISKSKEGKVWSMNHAWSESKGKQEVEGSAQPREAVQLGRTLAGGDVGSCKEQGRRAEVWTRPRRRD